MSKRIRTIIKQHRAIIIVLSLSLIVVASFSFFSGKTIYFPKNPTLTPTSTVASSLFTYSGKTGEDALSLLKEKTTIEQNTSGLVVTINNRKADVSKKEYWSFYINGKMASVGPAEYQTKDTDKIEWKVETY